MAVKLASACLEDRATLENDPSAEGAIALMANAHEALLARTDQKNFWEHGWIVDQIETWRSRLSPAG